MNYTWDDFWDVAAVWFVFSFFIAMMFLQWYYHWNESSLYTIVLLGAVIIYVTTIIGTAFEI